MTTETNENSTPITVSLQCAYKLTADSHRALALAGMPAARVQSITIEVDAATAIRRKLAYVRDDGQIRQVNGYGICGDGELRDLVVLEQGHGDHNHQSTVEIDHILTVEEAKEMYESAAARTEREHAEAETARAAKAEADRVAAAAALAALVERVQADIPRLEAGEGSIDSGFPYWYTLDSRVGLRNRADGVTAPDELCNRIRAIQDARDQKAAAEKEAAAAAALAERDAWIAAHGSDRLKKGLTTGLVDKMTGVYRSERIAIDLGEGWQSYDAVPENEDNDRINPSERELDAFLEARTKWPDEALELQLRSVRNKGGGESGDEPSGWRPALLMLLPWEQDRWAVKFLDVE